MDAPNDSARGPRETGRGWGLVPHCPVRWVRWLLGGCGITGRCQRERCPRHHRGSFLPSALGTADIPAPPRRSPAARVWGGGRRASARLGGRHSPFQGSLPVDLLPRREPGLARASVTPAQGEGGPGVDAGGGGDPTRTLRRGGGEGAAGAGARQRWGPPGGARAAPPAPPAPLPLNGSLRAAGCPQTWGQDFARRVSAPPSQPLFFAPRSRCGGAKGGLQVQLNSRPTPTPRGRPSGAATRARPVLPDPEPAGPTGAGRGASRLGRGRSWGLLAAAPPPPSPPPPSPPFPPPPALINNFHSIQKSSFPVCSQCSPYSPARVTESPSVSLCLMPLPGPRWPRARAQGVPEAAAQLRGQRAPVSASAGPAATAGPPGSVSAAAAPRAPLPPRSVLRAALEVCLWLLLGETLHGFYFKNW